MSEIRHRNLRKSSLPRTGRTLDAVGGTFTSVSGGTGSSAGGGVDALTDHGQLTGIISTADNYSDSAKDIHLTAGDADTLKKIGSLVIIKSSELGVISAADENIYSALSTDIRISDELDDFLHEIDEMYLRKDIDDTAHGNILFDKKIGSSVFIDGFEGKGWEIKETGAALLDSARIRSDIYVGNNTGSPSYASGFTGWGWQIDTPTATGEMSNLFIRKTFTAYEIVYSQIYGLGGNQIVSDLNKIARVEVMPDRYRCYMDDMDGLMLMNLRRGDGVRIQSRTGSLNIKYLTGRCIGVTSDYFDIAIPLLEGSGEPEAGNFAMRWGNNEDIDRQGLIYLTSADHGAPFIDVYDGITEVSTEGKLKARLGNLKGLRTKNGNQLSGYGAYLNGIYVENSTILLQNGSTIEQNFIAMNGKFESTIEGIRNDMSVESGNILRNSSFSENTHYWHSSNTVHFIDVGGAFMWMDGSFYTEKQAVANICRDGSKNVLRILNTTISQRNADFKGEKPEGTYSFAFYYKVLRAGTLTAGFTDKELFLSETLPVSESYQKITKVGKWDGQGDFSIGFTGEILVYGVSLFNDALADLQIKLQTQILQTEEYIKLLATKEYVDSETGRIYTKYDASLSVMAGEIAARVTRQDFDTVTGAIKTEVSSQLAIQAGNISAVSTKVDNVKNTIDTAGWINSTQGNALFASKTLENGQNIISYINQTPGSTVISSERINLYGAVTFNSFSSSLQSDIGNISSTANAASSNAFLAIRDAATAQSTATTAKNDASKAQNTANSAVTALNALPAWSKQASILKAMQDATIIVGGYIKTSLIDVDQLYVTSLAAVRGTIAAYTIAGNSIRSERVIISPENILFTSADGSIRGGYGVDTGPAEFGLKIPVWIENKTKGSDTNYGIHIDVANASLQKADYPGGPVSYVDQPFNNIAINIKNGCIAGMAFKVRQISSTTYLTNEDVWVSCYNSGVITVYLPSSPHVGKVVFIKLMNNVDATVNGNGKQIKFDNASASNNIDRWGRTGMYVYDGQYWCGGKIYF